MGMRQGDCIKVKPPSEITTSPAWRRTPRNDGGGGMVVRQGGIDIHQIASSAYGGILPPEADKRNDGGGALVIRQGEYTRTMVSSKIAALSLDKLGIRSQ